MLFKILSILLKSYWNYKERQLGNVISAFLSILLKSYWNEEINKLKKVIIELSILLKSYWNLNPYDFVIP
ncbi:MAG: hypothetical protein PWP49_403 [Thermococcaceae archaeon]|nr:hypothetical protein [Thermococcaceae archaeon]